MVNLEELRASALAPCIRLQVGPGGSPLDFFEVDQGAWEERKQEVIDFCLSLPEAEGCSWRQLKGHTGGNGMLAKLLVVLGDLAGVWKMHPPRDSPQALWTRDTPLVLAGTAKEKPKPSSGSLEPTGMCSCCERPMGPPDSKVHDLLASEADGRICLECDVMECDAEGEHCKVFPEKQATQRPRLRVEESEGVDSEISAYLKQFE